MSSLARPARGEFLLIRCAVGVRQPSVIRFASGLDRASHSGPPSDGDTMSEHNESAKRRRILLTSALPYANGSIHLGHLVEYLQTDFFARFHRMIGTDIVYVCADDTHGTAIELKAAAREITPQTLIDEVWESHTADFRAFGIQFDEYYTTHSPENEALAGMIYQRLDEAGHVTRRTTQQFYSEAMGRFLSDRMVKGRCPNAECGAEDQYGDVCEVCGKTYEPTDLIEPFDVHTGQPPVLRDTENLYVTLREFADFLREWSQEGIAQPAVRNFVAEWLDGGLEDWCISRAAPYFGFPIPGETDKYFYVWLDAPVGYIASTKHYADARGLDWLDWWAADSDAEVIHVIGKDIIYFHTLFWPAMLKAAGLKTPSRVQVHGMLTVNGRKMSKSRGTFIQASTYLEHLDPEYLRFYYASKLSNGVDDLDLSFEDFVNRVNADLLNKIVNLASRTVKFITKFFDGEVAAFDPAEFPVVDAVQQHLDRAKDAYEGWEFRDAVREIVDASVALNEFYQGAEPWALRKSDEARARQVCAAALHGTTAIMHALAPVTPKLVQRYAACLGLDGLTREHSAADWRPAKVVAPEEHLLTRVEAKDIEALVEASVVDETPEYALDVSDFGDEISFDDFAKIDLRVGVVEAASTVEKADKLLQLTVHCGKRINVFAGVRSAYPDPSALVGRRVIVVANLKPRKMRFGLSEGMLLAMSGPDDDGLQLVNPDASAKGGWTVR